MRAFRIIFVSLIAVGVCGVVYVGLTAGLAAYMRYKRGPQAEAPRAASPTTAPAASDDAGVPGAPSPAARLAPPPGVEDAASLLRRRWTAPRAGLSTPPAFVTAPASGAAMLIASGPRSTLPPITFAAVRSRFLKPERPELIRFRGGDETVPVLELADAAPKAKVVLPAGPAAKFPPAETPQLRVASIAVRRDADRPTVQSDPGAAACERLLLVKPAPLRTTAEPFVRLSIPEPAAGSLGDVMTIVADEDGPVSPPDRPAVKLPAK
jgi:hypothetical protein